MANARRGALWPARPLSLITRPGTYLWQAEGNSLRVALSLDLVDRISQEVMRGFGAVPRRGAEVGGVLLGNIHPDQGPLIELQEYEPAPIEYKRGPSYLLSEADLAAFELLITRLRSGPLSVVGFFRSNTREVYELTPEDLTLLDRFFPEPYALALLIKPYATRVATAGFCFRENGSFQTGPPLGEFPFRRKDLAGEDAAPGAVTRVRERDQPTGTALSRLAPGHGSAPSAGLPVETSVPGRFAPALNKARRGWSWLPFSFIFLMLGMLLGVQADRSLLTRAPRVDPYATGLSVTKDGDNLNIRWDRTAPMIRAARHGVLTIAQDGYSKPLDLDPAQLQTGSVVYQHSSGPVRFTLELTLNDNRRVVETLDWKEKQ